MKYWLFGTVTSGPAVCHAGLLVIRAGAGLMLALAHGRAKLPPPDGFVAGVQKLGFPAPTLFAWLATLSELLGGLLLAAGLLTRPAALLVLITMGVAAFGQHASDPFKIKELALLYGTVALGYLLIGSGRFGIDPLLVRRDGQRG